MDYGITYVGLDVHKETITVALADGGGRGDVRAFGQIANTPRRSGTYAVEAVAARADAEVLLRSGPLLLWHSTATVCRRS